MTRAFLLAVLAAPAIATAQTTTTKPPITFTEGTGTTDVVHGRWISLAECMASKAIPAPTDGSDQVKLSWILQGFPLAGSYQVYASTADITGTKCPTTNSTTPEYKAGTVGSNLGPLTGSSVNLQAVKIKDIIAAIQLTNGDCANVSGDTSIFICVQALDQGSNPLDLIATGRMILSITAPGAPTVSAAPADTGALQISWTAPGGSPPAYDYRISASSTDVCPTAADAAALCDPITHRATDLRTFKYIIDGLAVGATYTIDVYARSEAGNEGPKGTAIEKAVLVSNFWDVYRETPGAIEQGGCATAAGGPVALLALAALLAKLRRRA